MARTGDLFETSAIEIFPSVLTYDEEVYAAAKLIGAMLAENAVLYRDTIGIYYRIDELDETMLDILAGDLHVDWYNYDDSVEEKRKVIKSSIYVHRHLGTPAAVQRVVADAFEEAQVEEWFEYGGEPFHFHIITTPEAMTGANYEKFLDLLEKAKSVASIMDELRAERNTPAAVYQACAVTGVNIVVQTKEPPQGVLDNFIIEVNVLA